MTACAAPLAAALAVLALLAAPAVGSVSFMSIGDWGGAGVDDEHKAYQVAVAKGLAQTAAALKAAFVVNVGDNFY